MTQYNTLNVKLSNLQLNKSKSGRKNGIKVTLKLSSNAVNDSNNENIFPHKLLLANTQVSRLCKAFANNYSANVKLSKTQLHKTGQAGGFLGRFLGPLLKTGLPLMKNVLKPLAKNVLIPLGLTEAASATGATIHKKMFKSGTATLIISNEELNDIMKIIGYISISAFASLLNIPIGITSSAKGLKICEITAGIKKYMSIIKKKKKKHNKLVLSGKSILNSMKVLISKALIESNIRHDEFDLMKMC